MKYLRFVFIILPFVFTSCQDPELPDDNDFPYLTVDYRFTDTDVAVFSRHLAISNDNSAVYYTGEPKTGFENHIYRRPLDYGEPLVRMTSNDSSALGSYAVDLDLNNNVYYHQIREVEEDSIINVIYRADPLMTNGDPVPEEVLSFSGDMVGFLNYRSQMADYFTVSADGLVYIIGWSETGYYYLNFRDDNPEIFELPNVVEAILFPDGQKYVYADGSKNIFLTSTLLEQPVLIGSGRYISVSSNYKIAWMQDNIFHIYDMNTEVITKYNPPKNVTSADEMMNATLSEDGKYVAFRSYDYSDSDIVFCAIPE